MKKLTRQIISLFLTLTVLCLSASSAFAAVSYPQGVTDAQVTKSIEMTDVLVRSALPQLTGKTLGEMLRGVLYNDESITKVFVSAYSGLEQSSETLANLGLDVSTKKLAECLAAYPSAADALNASDTWAAADLSAVRWGVATETDFANLLACMLAPFNDVLYMLLCGGEYKASVLTLTGGDGYTSTIMPLLQMLECPVIVSSADFSAQASGNKNAMVYNIAASVLSLVSSISDAPANTLTRVLPVLADYLRGDGLASSVTALMEPITVRVGSIGYLFSGTKLLSFFLFLQDPNKYTLNFSENLPTILNDATESFKLDLPVIDLDALAECKGDQNAAYITLMRWMLELAKQNQDQLSSFTGNDTPAALGDALSGLMKKSDDELLALLIRLFTVTEGTPLEYQWQSSPFTSGFVSFTANLDRSNFEKVYEGIDEIINEAVVDLSDHDSVGEILKKNIYTNELLTSLAKGLYGALEGDAAQMLSALDIPVAPYQLAGVLSGGSFNSARNTLYRYTSWKSVGAVYWGFSDGSHSGFRTALAGILRPFRPALDMLLANGSITIFDSIHITGGNGYNTAVIPILEALGCNNELIKTYDQYVAGRGTDTMLTDLIDPVLALVDEIAERPVYEIIRILPNVLFFIDSGGIKQCLDNLIAPLDTLAKDFGLDLSAMTGQLDELEKTDILAEAQKAITDMLSQSEMKLSLPQPDIKKLGSFGVLAKKQSKRTFNGTSAQYDYIEADGPAIMVTVLRFIVEALKDPANADALSGLMTGGGGEEGDMNVFAAFSGGIGTQFADMTTDEMIEWLYKLFFRERALAEPTTEGDYVPTVIYQETKKPIDIVKPAIKAAVIVLMIAVVLILQRKNIGDAIYRAKLRKERRDKNAGA